MGNMCLSCARLGRRVRIFEELREVWQQLALHPTLSSHENGSIMLTNARPRLFFVVTGDFTHFTPCSGFFFFFFGSPRGGDPTGIST